jgi:N-acetylmuramoyl-L-alanine amidase
LALGHRGGISDDTLLRPVSTRISPKPHVASPKPTPAVSATPAPSLSPSVTPAPAGPVAVTNGFVHMRAAASTSSAILTDLQEGTTVTLLQYSDASWQQVSFNGQTGYIFKSYLRY